MVKRSKRYKKAMEGLSEKALSVVDAVNALQAMPAARFDETVELSFNLNVDPKQSNQMVRGTVRLPNGSGKKVRVVVFTEKPEEALSAGADKAGFAELIKEIEGGWLDFDVAISTVSAIQEVKAGRVEYKMDKTANMSVTVGKRSFSADKLVENVKTALASVAAARPEVVKGKFVNSVSISSTMSPSVKISLGEISE